MIPEKYLKVKLTKAQERVWNLIIEYYRETGERCFTYNSLIRFWPSSGVRVSVLTVDRRLREFVELELLEREYYTDKRGRKRARYCLPRDLAEAIKP